MAFQVRQLSFLPLKDFAALAYLLNFSEREFPHLQRGTILPGSQCWQGDMRVKCENIGRIQEAVTILIMTLLFPELKRG